MAKYKIYAGLSGGFGGASYQYTDEFDSEDDAVETARQEAIQIYQSYEGLYGIVGYKDIEENYQEFGFDAPPTDTEIEETYQEEVESWIEHWAEKVEE